MFIFDLSLRVRYSETDQMGYVYYGNYAQYYEVGRVESMRSMGLNYAEMENELGVMMPVMKYCCEYLRPVFYDELITVRTTVPKLDDHFIIFESEIINSKEKLCNKSQIQLCFIEMQSRKRISMPTILFDRLKTYYENDV